MPNDIGETPMSNDKTWLSLDETAEYLDIGKTTLYALAREGRIPASKVGKKWMFERASLDIWMRSSQPPELYLLNLAFDVDGENTLREPQRDGYSRVHEFIRSGKNRAIVQIPVGCGKSGLAAILPLGLAEGRALVIAPNLTIKRELFDAMDITNRRKCFWRRASVLSDVQMSHGPLACTLDTGNLSVASKSHLVISNVQQLATNPDKWLNRFENDFFDMIIVDEAHHSTATSWQAAIDRFPEAKVVLLTATPFRSDRQELDGELVYRYSFRSATLKGYIKRLKASYVAPQEIELGFTDKSGRSYTLDEVLQLKEEDWFSRAVALAAPCNEHIVDSSLAKLEELRESGTNHQLVAVACTINHARDIRSLYRERGYTAEVIHSKQSPDKQDQVLRDLRNGTLDSIVQVLKLGEGFDHPKLSVAAIFRPFRTLAPYIQFVGRIMRVVVQNDPAHPDNVGHIVTHLGMNLDQRLKEFKEFERDDQAFWEKVIGGAEPEVPANVREGNARLRVGEGTVVHGEIVDSLWEEDFTSAEDQQVIDDLRDRMRLLGLDTQDVEEFVKNAQRGRMRRESATDPFPKLPQRELEEARRRLNEQAKRLAKILLTHADLEMTGREIPYKYKTLKVNGRDNYVCALMMVNKEIGKRLGKERDEASAEEFKAVLEGLEEVRKLLVRRLRKAKADYEKSEA